MKKQVHTLLIVAVLSFLSMLIACSSAKQENNIIVTDSLSPAEQVAEKSTSNEMVHPPQEMLEQTFESDTLTAEQLLVFQQRGAEKLADFINYIEIISNKKYDKQLRLEVRRQIEDLFETKSTLVAIPLTREKESKPVYKFLNEIYTGTFDSIKVKTDSVVLSNPVKTAEPIKYEGSVSANVKVTVYRNKKMEFSSVELQHAKTIVIKVEKDFGGKKSSVWEVKLGEIE